MNSVQELEKLGFRIWIEDRKIRYELKEGSMPDKTHLAMLLDEIWRKKHEIIKYLQSQEADKDPFLPLFEQAVSEINAVYKAHGITCEMIRNTMDIINEDTLFKEARKLQDRVDMLWIVGLAGDASIDDFKEALNEWKNAEIKAIPELL